MATHRRKIPSDPEIGKRIRAALEYHRIRPVHLARMIGVSPAAVSQWMTGAVTPADENFRKMADVLGEDERWLQGKTVKGKQGFGALAGTLLEKVGEADFTYLAGLSKRELRGLIAGHKQYRVKTRRRKRPTPTR